MKLEPDRIFVRDGNIWSSAGITAGIDLALAMVAEDYGEEIAQKTARQLVLYHRRSGGQSQFSSLLELKAPSGRFGPLLTWAREHLDAPLTVEDLAEQAGMSSRHFARAFIAETGTTPSKAVERLRIEVARQRVQSSSEAIERVARSDRLSRSGADAPRLHPRLRPAAAIAAPRGAGGLTRGDHAACALPAAPSLRPSHSVVGAWIRIVIRMAMKVTEAIICAPGAFMPSRRPASAAGMTPVSRVQHMNSISAKLHRARRSGSAHRKTVAGRATSISTVTTATPPSQNIAHQGEIDLRAEQDENEQAHDERRGQDDIRRAFAPRRPPS